MIYSATDIPVWAAICIAFFLLVGATLALIGAIGFLRLPTFYERIHAPTLGTSWGVGGIMLGSMIFFSIASSRLAIHEILIGILVTVTTPVTLMMLARAALHRDRVERNGNVPPKQIAKSQAE
ncbi:cation:proton antiporter [Agrobacterium vitis]|uniref:Cation:proton antiporter n=1 Tax=Agrobacterium vitis TaxID=373 RepID=A0ABD6GI36_AGRVI|nr:monovalent cation/H(+) antiporter subunit G [Agrobacterium vitis]MUO80702.1 cation:proton antiporter [Agrobacterium vitis]MUO96408.1 cation:proton antiporter [Agrobacterium vitis]MUP07209.1 cation:proton antiporter [Agrobacterium vitis]MUZ82058.1 cation:proton antiporter [Agrobacterium vitis]MVA09790.1 cation:proton antiporter [Agrobacterium vitis]